MVTPLARSHPTSVCSFLSGIGGAIRRKQEETKLRTSLNAALEAGKMTG